MKRLLNERTGTVHKPEPRTTDVETACGALRHVPQRQVSTIAAGDRQADEEFQRCGRCFEGAGGY